MHVQQIQMRFKTFVYAVEGSRRANIIPTTINIFKHFSLVLMNRLNKTESAIYLYYRFSLFLKDPFFSEYLFKWSCQYDQDDRKSYPELEGK